VVDLDESQVQLVKSNSHVTCERSVAILSTIHTAADGGQRWPQCEYYFSLTSVPNVPLRLMLADVAQTPSVRFVVLLSVHVLVWMDRQRQAATE